MSTPMIPLDRGDGLLNLLAPGSELWKQLFLEWLVPSCLEGPEIEQVYARALTVSADARWADMCAGGGRSSNMVRRLIPRGPGVLVEQSPFMVESLKRAHLDDPAITIIEQPVQDVDAPHPMDLVTCMHGIYQTPKNQRYEFAEHMMRWVKVGGYFVLVMKTGAGIGNWTIRHLGGKPHDNSALLQRLYFLANDAGSWEINEHIVPGTVTVKSREELEQIMLFFACDLAADLYPRHPTVEEFSKLVSQKLDEQQNRKDRTYIRVFDRQTVVVMRRLQ